jgi:hypothetical protein
MRGSLTCCTSERLPHFASGPAPTPPPGPQLPCSAPYKRWRALEAPNDTRRSNPTPTYTTQHTTRSGQGLERGGVIEGKGCVLCCYLFHESC